MVMSNIISQLNRRSLVEYVSDAVLQSDGTYRCVCPFHSGATNPTSFAIFPSTNTFYCFSCHEQGKGVISFVQHRDACTYMQAVKTLCDDFGLTIDSDDSFNAHMDIVQRNEVWARGMQRNLSSIYKYLKNRGFTDETIKLYGFGYSTKNHVLSIPMRDEFGRCVAFLYRHFDGNCKYKNSKNVPGLFVKGEFLYGINETIKNLRTTKSIMLCEGSLDAASATQQGLCCMAYCGISITRSHADKVTEILRPIKGGKVILVPDNDGKASKFVLRAREIFRKYHPQTVVKVAVIPDGNKDLNDMLVNGLDITKDCKYESLDYYCAKEIIKGESDKEVQEKLIVEYMKSVSNPVVRADIAEYLAKEWNRDVSLVRELLSVKEDTIDEKLKDFVTVEDAYTALDKMEEGKAITTGFMNIDDAITMIKTDVTMIAGYSFSGKTSTTCQMILNWCIKQKLKVLFFSLEMPRQRVMQVLVAQIMGIPRHKVLEFIHENRETYQTISDKLSDYLYIIDRNDLSIDDIESYLKIANTHIGQIDVVIVDYFGYLRHTDTVEEQESTAKKMKAIAKRNNILLVMLAQLNKASQNKDKGSIPEPNMNQIKGAGGQGASADTILLLWKADVDTSLSPIDREKNRNISYIKVGKARESKNGNTIFKMRYDPKTSKVSEVVDENFLGVDKE